MIILISYNKLWKLLIDKKMTKTELGRRCNISRNTIARMGKNIHLSTEVLERICIELDCDLSDIVDIKLKEEDL